MDFNRVKDKRDASKNPGLSITKASPIAVNPSKATVHETSGKRIRQNRDM